MKLIKSILLVSIFATVVGCSGDDSGGNPSPVKSADDQIAAINANKDMPEQAKQVAIAQIKARTAQGPAQGPTATGSKK